MQFNVDISNHPGRLHGPASPLKQAEVEIPEASSAEAPEVLGVCLDPHRLILRQYDGRLFSTFDVHGNEGGVHSDVATVTAAGFQRWADLENFRMKQNWFSNPFAFEKPLIGRQSQPQLRNSRTDDDYRLALARRTAEEDFLLVDGRMWRRVYEPVWYFHPAVRRDLSLTSIRVPTYPYQDATLSCRYDSANHAEIAAMHVAHYNCRPIGPRMGRVALLDESFEFQRDDRAEIAREVGFPLVNKIESILLTASPDVVMGWIEMRDSMPMGKPEDDAAAFLIAMRATMEAMEADQRLAKTSAGQTTIKNLKYILGRCALAPGAEHQPAARQPR